MRYLILSATLAVITGLAVSLAAAEKHEGKVVEAVKGTLTMTDLDGKNKHTHKVTDSAKITLDGKPAKIDDLKSGYTVEVTTDGKSGATAISAKSSKVTSRTAFKVQATPQVPFRASKLIGATVKNATGDDLGVIEDFVVDPTSGQTKYAVLSFGGFLGIGDKYFAIPWHALNLQRDSDDKFHFVLHVNKERMKNAPGFDKNHWPDVGNPQWAVDVDNYFPAEQASLSPKDAKSK